LPQPQPLETRSAARGRRRFDGRAGL